MTRETFDAGMHLLSEHWPNHQLSPDVYWHVLRGMDDQVFQRSILACLATCKFFPIIAEIREKAEAVLGAAGLLPKSAEDAWQEVLGCGYHPDLVFREHWSNELVGQAARAVGQHRIFNADMHELGFLRKEFMDFYGHKREMEMTYAGDYLLTQALPESQAILAKGAAAA